MGKAMISLSDENSGGCMDTDHREVKECRHKGRDARMTCSLPVTAADKTRDWGAEFNDEFKLFDNAQSSNYFLEYQNSHIKQEIVDLLLSEDRIGGSQGTQSEKVIKQKIEERKRAFKKEMADAYCETKELIELKNRKKKKKVKDAVCVPDDIKEKCHSTKDLDRNDVQKIKGLLNFSRYGRKNNKVNSGAYPLGRTHWQVSRSPFRPYKSNPES